MAQRGMNRNTGQALAGRDHLIQSLQVLLSTPIGSRVMLPEYGSELSDLLDSPITASVRLQMNKTIFNAVSRWEPRFKLRQVQSVSQDIDGVLTFTLIGTYEGQDLRIDNFQPFVEVGPSRPIPTPETPIGPSDPTDPTGDPDFRALLIGDQALLIGDKILGIG